MCTAQVCPPCARMHAQAMHQACQHACKHARMQARAGAHLEVAVLRHAVAVEREVLGSLVADERGAALRRCGPREERVGSMRARQRKWC